MILYTAVFVLSVTLLKMLPIADVSIRNNYAEIINNIFDSLKKLLFCEKQI